MQVLTKRIDQTLRTIMEDSYSNSNSTVMPNTSGGIYYKQNAREAAGKRYQLIQVMAFLGIQARSSSPNIPRRSIKMPRLTWGLWISRSILIGFDRCFNMAGARQAVHLIFIACRCCKKPSHFITRLQQFSN